MLDFDEMRNAMINAINTSSSMSEEDHFARTAHLLDKIDYLNSDLAAYKLIADLVFGKGLIPCEHYANTGLYKSKCDWCKASQAYKVLTNSEHAH